jgi:S-disulfanyl-L-cysteine oxidoreductase SoxD
MRLHRLALVVAIAGFCATGWAQSPTYGLGKPPTAEEIRAWDIAISPTGKELPPGRGTAKEGAGLFGQRCAQCHGETGSGGPAPPLAKGSHRTVAGQEMGEGQVMATHAPYATVMWDYINRAMPLGQEGSLKPDEVYALTAFLLFKNGVIQEDDVMDQQSLPKVKMPNHDGYALLPEYKRGVPRIFANKPSQ